MRNRGSRLYPKNDRGENRIRYCGTARLPTSARTMTGRSAGRAARYRSRHRRAVLPSVSTVLTVRTLRASSSPSRTPPELAVPVDDDDKRRLAARNARRRLAKLQAPVSIPSACYRRPTIAARAQIPTVFVACRRTCSSWAAPTLRTPTPPLVSSRTGARTTLLCSLRRQFTRYTPSSQ